jgi:predicted AAA+ superfamily ATPase
VATEVKLSTLAADAGGADGPLDPRTVADHLQALERLMVLENQPAWRPHLRSKAALREAPRRHFCDPSLAVAALGGSPDRLLKDLEWLGLLFESLVIRDLRVLAQALDGELFHYRDDYGVEVDAIVQLRDGRWGAIEIKLGPGQVEAAAAGLLRFRQQIDTRRTGEPAFLAVVCGSGYGYRRADGIAVVPVGALGLRAAFSSLSPWRCWSAAWSCIAPGCVRLTPWPLLPAPPAITTWWMNLCCARLRPRSRRPFPAPRCACSAPAPAAPNGPIPTLICW